jgi:hypothetical protein
LGESKGEKGTSSESQSLAAKKLSPKKPSEEIISDGLINLLLSSMTVPNPVRSQETLSQAPLDSLPLPPMPMVTFSQVESQAMSRFHPPRRPFGRFSQSEKLRQAAHIDDKTEKFKEKLSRAKWNTNDLLARFNKPTSIATLFASSSIPGRSFSLGYAWKKEFRAISILKAPFLNIKLPIKLKRLKELSKCTAVGYLVLAAIEMRKVMLRLCNCFHGIRRPIIFLYFAIETGLE